MMEFSDSERESLLRLLTWRRDVRHFETREVPPPVVQQLRLAMDLAPSVGNSRPWRIFQVMKAEAEIKRWTARRKSAPVLDIIQDKTTVARGQPCLSVSASSAAGSKWHAARCTKTVKAAPKVDVRGAEPIKTMIAGPSAAAALPAEVRQWPGVHQP